MHAVTNAVAVLVAGLSLVQMLAPSALAQCEPVWTQRFDVPAARARPAMAYDAAREVVVLFGGDNDLSADDEAFRRLWEWNGVEWSHRTDVTGGPQAYVDRTAMVYDSWRGVLVVRIFKPRSDPPETWEFDGQNWSFRATGVPLGSEVAMASIVGAV